MAAIPRYRRTTGPALLSAGFRPFFLLGALWSPLAILIWLPAFAGEYQIPTIFPPVTWHVHEMVFGYGAAVVAGFLLTAIPNWTGRMPLQGAPLAILLLLCAVGRLAVLFSARFDAKIAALLDLAFPSVFAGVVAREILAGRNWRNLPMLGALTLLLAGNLLVHLDAVGVAVTAELGNRLGVATLLMLISFVGGRIVPSFTRNWLAKQRPEMSAPATFDVVDRAVLAIVALALVVWVCAPHSAIAPWTELAAGLAVGLRLARWRGQATLREPLLWILHLGYGWLAVGFILLAINGLVPLLPSTSVACAHRRSDRHYDACRDDARLVGAYGTPPRRGARYEDHLRAGNARRFVAPARAAWRDTLCSSAHRGGSGVERRLRALCAALCASTRAASGQRWDWSADLRAPAICGRLTVRASSRAF